MGGNTVSSSKNGKRASSNSNDTSSTFYRRPLPDSVTAFNSPEGRQLFAEALAQGGLDGSYWDLSENFVTQHEPASCATGTLAMVLNSLSIDPQQQWKGVWRWYFDEKQLDCCRPEDEVSIANLSQILHGHFRHL
jgi:glutathione gamma-glutamylcysteinyltransferase